jgi:hypothetical protein
MDKRSGVSEYEVCIADRELSLGFRQYLFHCPCVVFPPPHSASGGGANSHSTQVWNKEDSFSLQSNLSPNLYVICEELKLLQNTLCRKSCQNEKLQWDITTELSAMLLTCYGDHSVQFEIWRTLLIAPHI